MNTRINPVLREIKRFLKVTRTKEQHMINSEWEKKTGYLFQLDDNINV